jgi:hypothetical protein
MTELETIKHKHNIEPNEVPLLFEKGFALVTIFSQTIKVIPLTWTQVIASIPALIEFFREARPILDEMKEIIKR